MGQCNAPVFFFSQITQFFLGIFRASRPRASAKKGKGLRQSPLRGELVAIPEMVLGHELPEALRELLVVPGADGGRQGCLFEHLKPFLLIGKTKMADCSFLVNHFESIKPMG